MRQPVFYTGIRIAEENWQVSAPEGSIVLLDLVTYGYGEQISWDELSRRKVALEE